MSESRVPTWFAATGLHGENARVYQAFQRFLRNLPVSYTNLASEIGVSQPAVSRWASDVTRPSLEEMSAAVDVVRGRLDEIALEAERFAEVLQLIEEAMRLYDLEEQGRADLDPHQQRITARLRSELGLNT
jgi:transcriptional regulator with XRE-family HTH domain